MAYDSSTVPPSVEHQIRRLILAVLSFGLVSLFAELLVLGHYEDPWQFVPLAVILATLGIIVWHVAAGGAAGVGALRVAAGLLLVAGGLGIVLHYRGNVEFQLEVNPDLAGWALLSKVLGAKAPPALAPGVMAQLGFLGLIYTFRHPALRGASDERDATRP